MHQDTFATQLQNLFRDAVAARKHRGSALYGSFHTAMFEHAWPRREVTSMCAVALARAGFGCGCSPARDDALGHARTLRLMAED